MSIRDLIAQKTYYRSEQAPDKNVVVEPRHKQSRFLDPEKKQKVDDIGIQQPYDKASCRCHGQILPVIPCTKFFGRFQALLSAPVSLKSH